ncbi:UAA transporter [Tubulinosema ratisbonensis]|uniref:UDP-galactose transporter homolog 1 n=1 Tax=Tubulinosema ratisbonensis TaxID=291195 RepID=A0A437AJD9_9MICR|nr:UAA transporter [Tubulinosema ratisbonensis]
MHLKNNYFLFLSHVLGMYLFFMVYGYYQEKILTQTYNSNKFTYFTFLAVLHNLGGIFLSYQMIKMKKIHLKSDLRLFIEYFKCSFLKFTNLLLSYKITENISYPAFLIGRSCKIIPILIMNYVLYQKKFSKKKYFSACILTIGVLFFMFNSQKVSEKSSEFLGLIFLFFNLILDGSLNSVQDNIFKNFEVSSYHMMFYLNFISFFIGLFVCIFSGELISAIFFVKNYPFILVDLFCYSFSNVVGQLVVYSMLAIFGSVMLTTVTITRKLFTILFSIIIFKHSISNLQILGLILVFSSFFIDFTAKKSKNFSKEN